MPKDDYQLQNEHSSREEYTLHNKLVRDKIPAYLERLGVGCEIEVITDKLRLMRLLLDKLEEETQEAAVADDEHLLEELADVESVIDGILHLKGLTREELLANQVLKDETNGKLEKGIFLVKTWKDGPEVEEEIIDLETKDENDDDEENLDG